MFRHHLKMALRGQQKNKLFSLINIAGLTIGIAAAMLIINYVSFEFSFDKMHHLHDRIYRVESKFYEGNVLTDEWGTSSFGYGSAISDNIAGVEDFVRIGLHNKEQNVSYKNERSREDGIAYAGESFFSIFNFKLKEGTLADQLVRPNTVVITENVAKRFFKGENPVGKLLTFATGTTFYDCEVTGVLEDFPNNSHIRFNYLISYKTLPEWMKETWYMHEAYTYLLLQPGISPKSIEDRFPEMAEKYKTGNALQSKKWAISLVPLDQIHLNPQKQYEKEIKGNRRSLITLIAIAIVILLTAWINYINLATVRSMERAKDVGVRKVAGAFKIQLIRQYMVEAWMINSLAMVVAVLLVLFLKPVFNRLTGNNIDLVLLQHPGFWISALAVLLIGVILSGFYPAFVMTRVKPALILKGNYTKSRKVGATRQTLVVFQFAAALFLICGTFIVYQQVQFMQSQDLGVNIDRTIVMNYPVSRTDLNEKVIMYAENLREDPGIASVTLSGSVPGMEVAFFASNRLEGDGQTKHRLYEMLPVDDYFIETFNLQLLAGRSFKKGFGNEQQSILVNEAALQSLNVKTPEEAIGKKVVLEGEQECSTIIGVVKNWHQRGLENNYTPIMFLPNGRIGWIPPRFIAIRTAGKNPEQVLDLVKSRWNAYFPDAGFNYFFLNNFYDSQYKADKRFGLIVSIFTALAFFISILGLWALAAYTATQKMKEVGVRKVLGAQTGHVVYLFSKEIVILILVALLTATPLSYYVMNNWLQNYAFHTSISFWVYITGGLLTIGIAMTTVFWQSWRAATRNPVEALRYE